MLDSFGVQAKFGEPENGYTEVNLYIAPAGVKLFAMQYADSVEVLSPQKLRDEVRNALKTALEVYR